MTERLYLNRRTHPRVSFRKAIRFNTDPTRPLRRLDRGVSQNMSYRGMELLSSVVVPPGSHVDVWIPLDGSDVVKARATVKWVEIEATLTDSPYWLRAGLSLSFPDPEEKKKHSSVITQRGATPRDLQEQATTKVGFVF